MLLAACFRVDVPLDAGREAVEHVRQRLDELLAGLQASGVAQANLAISGSALLCFEREGFGPTLTQLRRLADARRIELVATPAHGALLPLLPENEVRRQLHLNEETNRAWFGDLYRPECLWPTELAVSPKVAAIAAQLGFSSLLVDEAAMRVWPAIWPGDRIDGVMGQPGVFAVPCSRAASARLRAGPIETRRELEAFVPSVESALDERYLVPAVEVAEMQAAPAVPDNALGRIRSMRLQDLFKEISLEGSTSLLPSSRRSTPDEAGRGLPFANWFAPENQRQAIQWRLLLRALDLLSHLHERGLTSHPAVGRLRLTLDLAERESNWRVPDGAHRRIQSCVEELAPMQDDLTTEVLDLCHALASEPVRSHPAATQPSL